jgi:hypothetical protein
MRPGNVALPRKVDFFRLPRPVQDRFAAATRRTAPPAPLLFRSAPRGRAWALLGASAVLAVIAVILLRTGWGDATSPLALHGAKMLALDIALFAGAAYGVVHAAAILRALDGLPYKAGTYLFPGCVVEAHGPVLRVWPVGEAEAIERLATPAPALALRMRDGSRVVVPARSVEAAERADAALSSLRPQLTRAMAEDDTHVLAELDPLHDSALSSPIGPTEAMKLVVPAWARFDFVIAASVGVVLGLALGTTRNSMSDEAMYRTVAAAATIPMYQQYLSQGGKHTEDVRDVLLPRAELQDAEGKGTVEAVQAFAQAHPTSKIQPEIDTAMKRALLAQLEKAKKLGTVTAIDEFQKKYGPASGGKLDADIKSARHALYVQALADWKKKAQPDPNTTAFMERLLGWAEKSGNPAVEVRFRLLPSTTLDDADKKAQKGGHYPGVDALPSRYLTSDAMKVREQRIALDVTQAFAADFPSDVVAVRVGDRLAADAPMPNALPTLVVAYAPEWARSMATSVKLNTVFAGLSFTFEGSFVLPDGAPLAIKTKAWRGPALWKMKPEEGQSRQDYEQKVYDAMIDGAFDQLNKKITTVLF